MLTNGSKMRKLNEALLGISSAIFKLQSKL